MVISRYAFDQIIQLSRNFFLEKKILILVSCVFLCSLPSASLTGPDNSTQTKLEHYYSNSSTRTLLLGQFYLNNSTWKNPLGHFQRTILLGQFHSHISTGNIRLWKFDSKNSTWTNPLGQFHSANSTPTIILRKFHLSLPKKKKIHFSTLRLYRVVDWFFSWLGADLKNSS